VVHARIHQLVEQSGTNLEIGSSMLNFPCSWSFKKHMAVNCFLILGSGAFLMQNM